MSTPAQIAANQSNAQHSTGPKTAEGKAASACNNFRHGFAGAFLVLPSEKQEEFDSLLSELRAEHQPATLTESLLIEKMAQSYWLARRALVLQQSCFAEQLPDDEQQKRLALYLRYQTTHDRAFHKALNDLLKLRAEKRKAEIGFESQKQKQAAEARKEADENRKGELHKWRVLLAEAEVDHRVLLNMTLETPENRRSVTVERILAAQKAA